MGHYGFLIGGLWLLFFRYLDRSPSRAGAIAGMMTLKPHLGLLIALTMISRMQMRAITVACIVTTVLVGSSMVVFDSDLWHSWIFDTSALQTKIMTAPGEKFYYFMMPSLYIALRNAPMSLGILG